MHLKHCKSTLKKNWNANTDTVYESQVMNEVANNQVKSGKMQPSDNKHLCIMQKIMLI